MTNTNKWEKLLNIDRRWLYLLIAVVVIAPFFIRMGLPVVPTQEVRSIYNLVDSLGPDDAIFIGWDFDPGTEAENQRRAQATARARAMAHLARA